MVHLDAALSPAEQERAQEAAAAGDARIALALKSSDYGLFQVIAAAPQLVTPWKGADPYAAAVLNVAIDALRLGVRSPLTLQMLRTAAPGYCDARQRPPASADWFEAAMAYATEQLHGVTAALAPVAAATRDGTGGNGPARRIPARRLSSPARWASPPHGQNPCYLLASHARPAH